ncbi:MAG TPA: VOC family protein [Rhizomicrobium sp.]|jgi:catechol 2,3-dioxygenase-like lactoylglutathione lyase family enzyme|nr:VOC family protein [Rhizomicrobium sp.]
MLSPEVPFALRAIDHVVLRVRDLDRSLAFYQGVLGCTLDKVQDTIGLWQVRAGASLIDLIPLDGALGRLGGAGPAQEGRNLDHFAIQITPFDEDAIRAHLAAHGATITGSGQRHGAEGDGPSIYVLDPDGNTVELKGPPSPVSSTA